jgi:hypothetical protein
MDKTAPFNLTIFTDVTKKICIFSFIAIILILLFLISPLSSFYKTSIAMKIIIIILLIYIIYLNNSQINLLKKVEPSLNAPEIKSQLNTNIICSYFFTVFIVLLLFFIIKSFL